ncbi:hypothetical protein BV349_01417 [Pseudomonas syringae pv. actinidiae]|nr:hypothetical protein BV349_01417 [Pseudomonas syringae pv. actinidiae]OSN78283.1 hypothetical protein BV351_01416 [Pseudomonas syringae pv. actinidiae]RMR98328.1 hypothetical protein ALP75_204510 [Pseudomonas syringae pv. actinidiae]
MSVQTLGVRKNTIVPTLSAHRYTTLLLILAGGRGSELVREGAGIVAENAAPKTSSSRTSSLPRPAGRSVNGPILRALQDLCINMSAEREER